MQTLHQATIAIMSQWPEDKYRDFIGYMQENMSPDDIQKIEDKRRIMAEHGKTSPRKAGFTLILGRD